MMKHYLRRAAAVVCMSLLVSGVWAQTVTIPAANTNTASNRKPYGCFFGFERTAAIYTSAEIGVAGTITDIAFFVNSVGTPANTPVMIYMKETAAADMPVATTVATEESGATLVYSGTVTAASLVAGNWTNVTLTTPFVFTNTMNLEVIIEANFGGSGGEGSTAKQFRFSNGAANCTQTWQQDGSAPTGTGSLSASRPNVQLMLTPLSACSGIPTAGTANVSPASACGSGTFNLSVTGSSTGSGIVYQWMSSPTPGGPYTNVPSGNTASISTGSISSTTYYVCQVTCTNSSQSDTTNEVAAVVFPAAVIGVSPTSTTLCQGSAPVALTATGGSTYAWAPPAGLSATTGASVTASPLATTTYTVTGTDANGCTGTATATITVVELPSLTSLTATPASVCNGGNSQLLAAAGNTSAYTQSAATFAPIASGSGTTVLSNNGTAVTALTAGSLDDGYWNNQALPFTFNFYGAAYNQISIQTNGTVSFSAFGTTTGYPQTLPSATAPNNMIAGCFGDLDWRFGGVISTYTSGVAPNRVFVINYNGTTNGGFYNGGVTPTVLTTFQIQLHETSNIVQIHNTSIAGTTTVAHTQGIENAGGTAAEPVAGRNNNTTWTATNDAVQFAPSGGTFTYAWTPATFLSSTTIANPVATGVTATTAYSVTITGNGCSVGGSLTVTVGAALASSSSASPGDTVCEGTTVTLNNTTTGGGLPYTYSWTGPNSFSSSVQNPVLNNTTPAQSGQYILTVTDACSTVQTTTVTLTVDPLPAVAVTPTSALFCSTEAPIALTASGASTYSWGPATGLSATTGANVDASPAATTSYTVTGTDANGCVATASTTITFAVGVTASATTTMDTICAGSTTDLNAGASSIRSAILTEDFNTGAPTWTRLNSSTGGNPANAAWTDRPDGFVYAAGTPYHSNDNTQFVQTNSDAQGSGSTTRTALVSPAFSTVGQTGAQVDFYHYYRDIGDNGDSAVVEYSFNATNWTIAGAYTANTGSENAFAAGSITLPAATDNQPVVYVRFRYIGTWDWYWSIDNVTISTLNTNSHTYSWTSIPTGFTSSQENPSGVMPSITTEYVVEITTAGGCSAIDTVEVAVNALPVVNLGADVVQCAGTVTLDAQNAGATYLWQDATTNQTLVASVTGQYSVDVTDANGCVGNDTVMVTINPLPVVDLGADTAQCAGTVTLDAQNAGATYLWQDASTNQTLAASVTGQYSVEVTDANGCVNNDTVEVTINALPVVDLGADSTQCGGTITLDAMNAGATYQWSDSTVAQTLMVSTSGQYSVWVTDANGCESGDTVMVTINTLPSVALSLGLDTACLTGGSIMLTGESPAGGVWSGTAVTGNSFDPQVAGAGMHEITYTYTDTNGCEGIATDSIMVDPCLDVVDPVGSFGFQAYPNPNSGVFQLTFNGSFNTLTVEVYTVQGQLIYSDKASNAGNGYISTIDLSSYANGSYIVKATTENESVMKKVIKQD